MAIHVHEKKKDRLTCANDNEILCRSYGAPDGVWARMPRAEAHG